MKEKLKKILNLKNAAIALAASAAISYGAHFYSLLNEKTEKPVQSISSGKVYAVLANGSGPTQAERFSEENSNYSMLNVLSFYKFLKQNGVSDSDISLLTYNPAKTDIFKTKEYKSLLEKKLFDSVLPSKEDKIEIDGEATKDNFINEIKKIKAGPNDIVYLVLSVPSPKEKISNGVIYSTRTNSIELDKESMLSYEFAGLVDSLKDAKKIIIMNTGDANNFLSNMEINSIKYSAFLSTSEKREMGLKNTFALSSPEDCGFEKETFIMKLVKELEAGDKKTISEVITKMKNNHSAPQAYYFDGNEKSVEESPDFYAPLFRKN